MAIVVTNIGTNSAITSATTLTLTGVTVPAGAAIVVATLDNGTTSTSGTLADGGTNTYTKGSTLTEPFCAGCYFTVTNCAALTSATLTWTRSGSGALGHSMSAFYVTGVGALDSAVTAVSNNNTSNTNPLATSLTSGTPSQAGDLFVAFFFGSPDNAAGYIQDTTHGWAAPPTHLIDAFDAAEIGGGTQVNAGTGTKVFAAGWDTAQGNAYYALAIIGFAPAAGSGTSALPGAGSIVATGKVPTVAAGNSVTPGVNALTVTGRAPTVTTGNSLVPGAGAVTVTGFAPTIAAGVSLVPGTGSVLATGLAPAVTAGNSVVPGLGAVTFTGLAPSITQTFLPGAGAITVTGLAPAVTSGNSITAGLGALTVTGFAPVVAWGTSLTPGAGQLQLTGQTPSIGGATNVAPGTGSLLLTGFAPAVAAGTTVAPGVGSIVLDGFAPTPAVQVVPGAGAIVVTGAAPTIAAGTSLTTALGTVTLTGFAPTVSGNAGLIPDAGVIAIVGHAPTVAYGISLIAGTGSILITGLAPIAGNSVSLTPGVGHVTITGLAPDVGETASASPGVGTITVIGLPPHFSSGIVVPVGTLIVTGFAPIVGGASRGPARQAFLAEPAGPPTPQPVLAANSASLPQVAPATPAPPSQIKPGLNDISIIVGGQQISGWQHIRMTRGLERLPSDFEITITERFPSDTAQVVITPGAPCKLMIGTDLILTGYVDRYDIEFTPSSHTITVAGRNMTQDLVDCSAIFSGMQRNGTSIMQLANEMAKPFGVQVKSPDGDGNGKDYIISLQLGETPFEILERVARYEGMILYDDPTGALVIARIGKTSAASGFAQGVNVQEARAGVRIDQRFSDYIPQIMSQDTFSQFRADGTPSGNAAGPTQVDPYMKKLKRADGQPRYRPHIIISEQFVLTQSLAALRALWEAARRAGRSQQVRIVADNWRDSGGKLWTVNTLASVMLPTAKLLNIKWIVAEVSFVRDASGSRAEVVLMPPSAFDPEPSNLMAVDWQVAQGLQKARSIGDATRR